MTLLLLLFALGSSGCPTAADDLGVGAECAADDQCPDVPGVEGDDVALECLDEFAGGYCGLTGCATTADCPEDAICVAHEDSVNYCFRSCLEKEECNTNRSEADEANCVASFDWADPSDDDGSKACVPPSSGR